MRALVPADIPAALTPNSVVNSGGLGSRLFFFNGSTVGTQNNYTLNPGGPTFNAPQSSSNLTVTLPARTSGTAAGSMWLVVNTMTSNTITIQTTSSDGTTIYGTAPGRTALLASGATNFTLQPGQSLWIVYTSQYNASYSNDWLTY